MCGFAGFFDPRDDRSEEHWADILDGMGARLRHRGPDDGGRWTDVAAGIGLAHRRLAIVDLSPAGHQPMHSRSGRFVIGFNGEIYNHLELRDRLDDAAWRGHSDTETLLACFDAWGVERTLQAAVGMFAIALWDRERRTLVLARDRLGEKPLYYGWQAGVLLFGSELGALRAHPAFQAEIDRSAIARLLRRNAIGAPDSIYRGIGKLPPGTWLSIGPGGAGNALPESRVYWSLADVARRGLSNPFQGTPDEAVDAVESQLASAIGLQRMADVPLGAFLSGGVDSSTVVALMQAQSTGRIKTFSIGFHEQGYDEAQHAKAVARHLGTEHTELYVTPTEALAVVPRLPEIWDEPFADSSQIPTFLVAKLAREQVTVALSGDGGDELFGGYGRYGMTRRLWRRIDRIPAPLRRLMAGALLGVRTERLDAMASRLLPARVRGVVTGDRLQKFAEMLSARDGAGFYRQIVSHWKDPASIVLGASEPPGPDYPKLDLFSHMMLQDGLEYLPDDILVKVDRAAMAVSLETRVPMLDHRLVELAWAIPNSIKERDGQGKWPLRQVLHRHVPRELVDRPKMGFGVPIDAWLRGPLREWAESLLDPARLRREGFFDPTPIRRKLDEHLGKRRNWGYYLWDVLMFEAWLERHHSGSKPIENTGAP